jgi:uncharacterized protein YqfB (UPF0267 family)
MYGYDIFFLPRFEADVSAGRKLQTIRSRNGLHPPPGALLRLWVAPTGLTSDPRHICNTVCTESVRCSIYFDQAGEIDLILRGSSLEKDADEFAVRDGFPDASAMARFWHEQYGAPLGPSVWSGWLTAWEPPGSGSMPDLPPRHPSTNIGE